MRFNPSFLKHLEEDPFRLFFPLGIFFGIVGVAPWIANIFGYPAYPVNFHRNTMINGFLLTFVTGFLMTAIPRFTEAGYAKIREILPNAILLIAAQLSLYFGNHEFSYLFTTLAIGILLVFARARFLARKTNPPHTFVFVGAGLLLWFFTNIILGFQDLLPQVLILPFQKLFSTGIVMCFVMGVGGRLLPSIFGFDEIVLNQKTIYEQPKSFWTVIPGDISACVFLFLSSYFGEPFFGLAITSFIRLGVASYIAYRYWGIGKAPKRKSVLSWSLWISAWSLILGLSLPIIWRGFDTHSEHVIFVSGFSLMTLMVATRVTLAHGNEGLRWELRSKTLIVIAVLLLLSMITRVTAVLMPQIYLTHLAYAAILWVGAAIIWIFSVGRKITK